jgi:hypothetical protein
VSGRYRTAAGIVLAVIGLAAIAAPDLFAAVPTGRPVLLGVGLVLLLLGFRTVNERRTDRVAELETPDAEVELELPTPGDGVDRDLTYLRTKRRYDQDRRQELRDRLEVAVVDAIVRHRGCSREEAYEVLKAGEWTADPYAAAFFTHHGEQVPVTEQVRNLFGNESPFTRRARHAMYAVHELTQEVAEA